MKKCNEKHHLQSVEESRHACLKNQKQIASLFLENALVWRKYGFMNATPTYKDEKFRGIYTFGETVWHTANLRVYMRCAHTNSR